MESDRSCGSLQASVLVLNRFYMPVHVVSVKRSLVLLYRELAEVIHVEEGQYYNYDFPDWIEFSEFVAAEVEDSGEPSDVDWIRSVNFSVRVPRIVRLYRYDKVPKLTLRFNRRNVFARDNNTCQYCAQTYPLHRLSFDHVVPRSRGGKTNWENVVCCCLKCNSRKGNRTPAEAGIRLVKEPKRPRQNPLLVVKLDNPKYHVWRNFLPNAATGLEV